MASAMYGGSRNEMQSRNRRSDYQYQGRGDNRQYQSYGNQYQYSQPNSRFQQNYSKANNVEISKEIVRILRHGKYKHIKMDKEGYAKVDDILNDRRFQDAVGPLEFEDIKHIVETNDKKRFEMKEVNSEFFIKATQGHTVQVESLALTPLTDPKEFDRVFHGTSFDAWEQIKINGLNRMKRNHIHFAIGLYDDDSVISGMRRTSDIAIEIDMEKAMKAGLKFFVSSNKVILSEGDAEGRIHPKFFSRVYQLYPMQLIRFDVPPDFVDGFPEKRRNPAQKLQARKEIPAAPAEKQVEQTKSEERATIDNDMFDGEPQNDEVDESAKQRVEEPAKTNKEPSKTESEKPLNAEESAVNSSINERVESKPVAKTSDSTKAAGEQTKSKKKSNKKGNKPSAEVKPKQPTEDVLFVLPNFYAEEINKPKQKEKPVVKPIVAPAVKAAQQTEVKEERKAKVSTKKEPITEPEFVLPGGYVKSDEPADKQKKDNTKNKGQEAKKNQNQSKDDKSKSSGNDKPSQKKSRSGKRRR